MSRLIWIYGGRICHNFHLNKVSFMESGPDVTTSIYPLEIATLFRTVKCKIFERERRYSGMTLKQLCSNVDATLQRL